MPYSAYILIANFKSDADPLQFRNFAIHKVTTWNWQRVLKMFPGHVIQDRHYIHRDYPEVPPDVRNPYGLGRIPFDSEDVMLLLRLFKPGDICFVVQVTQTPEGLQRQYPYPQAFSDYYSTQIYSLNSAECKAFDTIFAQAPSWAGWNSAWFKISRRYFLWGGSKAFSITRRELERILDFFIALEAALVPEHDFVGRRLRERAAALLGLDHDTAGLFKKRLGDVYGIRSIIAHGGIITDSQVELLHRDMPHFEKDVRDLLKQALQDCPADEEERRDYLRSLYDIPDQVRADRLKEDFKAIKTIPMRKSLHEDLKPYTG
jgi:hypothetical protein